jgi:H+/Cl- antiporter ClcA
MKKEVFNELKLVLLCIVIGGVSSLVFWVFLLAVKGGTALLWEVIPGGITGGFAAWYPLVLCLAGGLIIGIFRKKFGDYPEEMTEVFGKLKKTGSYPYQKMPVLFVAALLPLIFGSSVGPEAGMVGIIVALCCWVGESIRFAGKQSVEYSRIGAAVSLSVIFRSPLFGIFEVEENPAGNEAGGVLRKPMRILLYCIAAGAAFGSFFLLNRIVKASEGFPSFDRITPGALDCVLSVMYLTCGILLGLFFEYTELFFEKIGKMLPSVLREMLAGLILGGTACLLPVIRFSGEEQMGILITDYARYAPLAMIGIAFLKVALTNMCIRLGLKGGHFFPLIFAAVCLGYGLSLLVFPGDASHATFAAAVSAAGTLGVSMKKPLAVSMLLLICFPANALLWIVPASAIAAFIGQRVGKKDGGI